MKFHTTRREMLQLSLAGGALALSFSCLDNSGLRQKESLNWHSLQVDTHLNSIKSTLSKYKQPEELVNDVDKETIRLSIKHSIEELSKANKMTREILGFLRIEDDIFYTDCVHHAEYLSFRSPPTFKYDNLDLRFSEFKQITDLLNSNIFPLGAYTVLAKDDSDLNCVNKIDKLNKSLKEVYNTLSSSPFTRDPDIRSESGLYLE